MPFVKFSAMMCVSAYFVSGLVYISVAGGLVEGSETYNIPTTSPTVNSTVHLYEMSYDANMRRAVAYHAIGCLWTVVWLIALADIAVAGAVGNWYFASRQNGHKQMTVRAIHCT